ncbi:MAG: HD domain-containing protein [Candidatus Melainabacteria bacterium]|jgi:hypothetical protein|nr:HD domain-containing protein [Candidatus Melainabacteria bacterium]
MTVLTLEAKVAIVEAMFADPELLNLYDAGDKMSSAQTKHDAAHAFSVLTLANQLTDEIHARFPEMLSDVTRQVIIPAGAFLHDVGRAIDVNDHAGAGAKLSRDYLDRKGLPTDEVKRIAAIVACHRSEQYLKFSMQHLKKVPELSIVVIADKCVGDEDRVRPGKAFALRILRAVGLAGHNFWENAEHDRVNFAIKKASLMVDSDDAFNREHAGAIVLKLDLDEKVAPATEVLSLYAKRFHSCGRAAKSLGFLFRIEFNGVRYQFDDDKNEWKALKAFHVPMT